LSEDQNNVDSLTVESIENRLTEILENDYSTAVEALLFASPEPLEDKEIARIVGCKKKDVQGVIDDLNERYQSWDRAFRIENYGGRFRIFTLAKYDTYISKLAEIPRPARLSKAALEVLSIIAYRQPTSRADIERLRGVNPDGVLRNLVEKGLIEISGRSDGPGRPLLYGTTREFLDFFGIEDLSELPVPETSEEDRAAMSLELKRPAESSDLSLPLDATE